MFLLVATNYFSKWVKAEAYVSIKDKDVSKFIWKNIVCRFRIPRAIITNNGPQFDNAVFRTFCSKLDIKNLYSTPLLSTKQQISRGDKQNPIECSKKNVGMSERKMGRWVARSCIGLPNNIQMVNMSYSFHPYLSDGSHQSNRNWHAYCQNSYGRSKGRRWRTHMTIGLSWRKVRKCSYLDGFLLSEDNCSVQQKSTTTIFPTKIFGS